MNQKFKELPPLQKQLIKFTLIGILAVLVDMACYYVFLNIFPAKVFGIIPVAGFSKTLSFICGAFVTYSLNKLWTWKQKNKSVARVFNFFALYGVSLLVNVGVNAVALYVLHHWSLFTSVPRKYFIAFIMATGVSAGMNFLGQKFWVFKGKK